MDLRKAYETLGLARGSSSKEVEAAYERLRDDVEARLSRVNSGAVAARYRDVRTRLDTARETLLAIPLAPPDEPLAHAFEVLGLSPNASALDVASAYVALCEEIDREVRDAPTEELRRACLEARADVDAAYQRCALSPLRDAPDPAPGASGSTPAHYETQMSAAPFEAPKLPEEAQEPALRIEPDEESADRRRRRRGRGLRRLAIAASVALLFFGAGIGLAWWNGIDLPSELGRYVPEQLDRYVPESVLSRLAPPGPPPELVEARTTAEALRRRVSEEGVELQSRVEESRARATELEGTWASVDDLDERERMAAELDRVRARRDLAAQHAELAERHVLASPELTAVYGEMERANELVSAGDAVNAVHVFSDARVQLEEALARLDVVEEAVGARSEAEAGFEAWRRLAASAELDELEPATRGAEVLAEARELLAGGDLDAAVPELQRAAQQFAAAIAEGRKLAADREDAEAAQVEAEAELASRELARADASTTTASVVAEEEEPAPAVSTAPPDRERAAIKLVLVPAGSFTYGEAGGQRMALDAFRIDRTEVRVNEYRACVAAGACATPGTGDTCNWNVQERGDHPINCVDWSQARSYCGWVGKRLPTEHEWEKAARGTDGRTYPWGNDAASCFNAVIAGGGAPGCGRGTTSPVGSRAEGRSPFGLFDMAGNVLEWTSDVADGGLRVVRGGSWRGDASPARSSFREKVASATRDARIGFRCAAQATGLYAVTP